MIIIEILRIHHDWNLNLFENLSKHRTNKIIILILNFKDFDNYS